jgi:hypothetical protein
MTAYRNIASDWLDNTGAPVWTKRIGNRVGTVFEVFDTGLRASHDYRRLTAQVSPEEAARIVFQKHFSK